MTASEANGYDHQRDASKTATLTAQNPSSNHSDTSEPALPENYQDRKRTLVLCFDGTGDQLVSFTHSILFEYITSHLIGSIMMCVSTMYLTLVNSFIHIWISRTRTLSNFSPRLKKMIATYKCATTRQGSSLSPLTPLFNLFLFIGRYRYLYQPVTRYAVDVKNLEGRNAVIIHLGCFTNHVH